MRIPTKFLLSRYQNIQLKKIEKLLDIPHLHLTTYVPRHAWASIARENGVSLSVISEGMGHTSEKTTRIYLASLSQVVMDEANHKVLSSGHSLNITKSAN